MAFTRWRAVHHLQRHVKGEAKRFTQHRRLGGKRVQGDAHVVIDELYADAHARPAGVNQLIAHRH